MAKDPLAAQIFPWSYGEKAPPFTIEVHLTNKCNFNCLFCWLQVADKAKFKKELDDQRWLELVKESAELGAKEWRIIGGGEPLIRRNLAEKMMILIKEKGMSGNLTTNGSLFTDKTIELLVDIGWDYITFSHDGPDEATHDFLRNAKGSFKKSVEAMRAIKNARQKKAVEKPITRLHMVLCHYNYRKLPQMIRFANEMGCRDVLLQPMTVYSEKMRSMAMTNEDLKEFAKIIDETMEIAKELNIYTNAEALRRTELLEKTDGMDRVIKEEAKKIKAENRFLNLPCFEPWYLMLIRPDGLITPCNKFDYDGEDGINKSLKEIWFGDFFNRVRNHLLSGELLPVCARCCLGGILENWRLRNELLELHKELIFHQKMEKASFFKKSWKSLSDLFKNKFARANRN